MEPIKTLITVGKYKFQIIDNTLYAREEIYCRNFKIGGSKSECVNVSIQYDDNVPISAKIPYIAYDPDCSDSIPLDRGQGSKIMIKTLLDYIHMKIPTITEISFEDKSNIECANEKEIKEKGSKFRKKGSNIVPIPLYYFSIAFNGETWYEKYFNARHKNLHKHNHYKSKINTLLYSEEVKKNTSFSQFLKIAQPPMEIIEELKKYYNNSITFGKFFQSMPKIDRCKLVRDWITTFMSYHLKDVFDNTDWIIELPIRMNGGRKNTRKYYCPKAKIMHNKSCKDFGINNTNF